MIWKILNVIGACSLLLCIVLWGLIGYGVYRRHQNLKKPCVPFHPGMSLEPGQCASIELRLK